MGCQSYDINKVIKEINNNGEITIEVSYLALINTIDYELVLCLSRLFKLVFICEEF
jgi:hypothetical protein